MEEETKTILGKCYVCRASHLPENFLGGTAKSGQLYIKIIENFMAYAQLEASDEDSLCPQCVTIVDEIDFLFHESQILTQLMQRLLQKRLGIESEIDLDLDEVALNSFTQKKSKFLCQKCDFIGHNFEVLSVHLKFHEIQERRNNEYDEEALEEVEIEMKEEEEDEVVKENIVELWNEEDEEDEMKEEHMKELYEVEIPSTKDEYEMLEERDEIEALEEDPVQIFVQEKQYKPEQAKHMQAQTFLRELENSHSKDMAYSCGTCSKLFTTLGSYNQHIRWHENPLRFECPEPGCGLKFRAKTHVNNHFARKHSNERNFICVEEDCGKAFATLANLNRHKKIHSNTFLHQCPYCEEGGYHVRRDLKRHIRRIHPLIKVDDESVDEA